MVKIKDMNEIKKFKNMVRECLSEIKKENDPRTRLKESLRGVVRDVLKEVGNLTNRGLPEQDKEEKESVYRTVVSQNTNIVLKTPLGLTEEARSSRALEHARRRVQHAFSNLGFTNYKIYVDKRGKAFSLPIRSPIKAKNVKKVTSKRHSRKSNPRKSSPRKKSLKNKRSLRRVRSRRSRSKRT